jgi:hypothetical protein
MHFKKLTVAQKKHLSKNGISNVHDYYLQKFKYIDASNYKHLSKNEHKIAEYTLVDKDNNVITVRCDN